MSLKTKISVAVSVLIAALLLTMATVTFNYFERSYKKAVGQQQFLLAENIARSIDDKLDSAQNVLAFSAKDITPEIAEQPERAQSFLDTQAALLAMFDNHIFIFSPAGRIVAEAPYVTGRRGLDYSHREYIQTTLKTKEPHIGAPYVSSQEHRHPSVMLTAPVCDQDGRVIAILAGGLDLLKDNFLGRLPMARIGKGGYYYLATTDLQLIIHPEAERMLTPIPPGGNLQLERAIAGFEGYGEGLTSRGIPMLSGFKRLEKTNWILAANSLQAEVYEPFMQAKRYFLWAIPMAVLLLVAVVWYVVRQLTQPLLQLTAHMADLGAKTGENRLAPVGTNDEIGKLAGTFNAMLSELDDKAVALTQSRNYLESVINAAGEPIFVKDRQHRWVLMNEAFCNLLGLSKETLLGKSDYDFLPREQADVFWEKDEIVFSSGVENVNEEQITDGQGVLRTIVTKKTRYLDEHREQYLVGVIADVTSLKAAQAALERINADLENKVEERTQELAAANQELTAINQEYMAMNEELQYANDELQEEIQERQRIAGQLTQALTDVKLVQNQMIQSEKMAALGNLVAGMAHEINTPIGVGITASSHLAVVTERFVEVCRSGAPRRQDLVHYLEDLQESSTIIQKNLERAGRLIQSFKQVSADQANDAPRKFNLRQYLAEILLSLNPQIKKTRHHIVLECDEQLNITGAPGALAQVVTNLVMNSLTHAYQEETAGELRIRATQTAAGELQLVYSDDGEGMAEEVRSKIFDPFFTTRRGSGGTGLGLYVVYNIVTQQWGGRIECESVSGAGTTFTMTIPLAEKAKQSEA